MFTVANLGRVCDMLVADSLMHEGQVKDVMVRYSIQEKRILIDRRNHLRKSMGRRRITYEVGEMEIIASFNFPIPGREKQKLLTGKAKKRKATSRKRGDGLMWLMLLLTPIFIFQAAAG